MQQGSSVNPDHGVYEVGRGRTQSTAERFLPCLMTRLTDHHPEELRERQTQAASPGDLRREIVQNIELILNSRSHPRPQDLGGEPVASSVLGFGLGDFCGAAKSKSFAERLRAQIERQVRTFEPRLAPESVRVTLREVGEDEDKTSFHYSIYGQINVAPLTGEMLLFTELDLELSKATVGETD